MFVTASYWPGGKTDPKQYPEHHVACYRAADGKLLWDVKVEPGPWLFADLRGGYTAPTPAADAERVYVVFGSAVIAALDHDGKPVWRKEIKPYKFDVALAASPVLFGDTVILQCDQVDKRVAADRVRPQDRRREVGGEAADRRVRAQHAGRRRRSAASRNCSSPRRTRSRGSTRRPARCCGRATAKGDTVSPVLGGGLVYFDSGRGGPGVAVDPTGTGDVTKTHLKWKLAAGAGGVLVAGRRRATTCTGCISPDVLKCVKLATGEVVYSERLRRRVDVGEPGRDAGRPRLPRERRQELRA